MSFSQPIRTKTSATTIPIFLSGFFIGAKLQSIHFYNKNILVSFLFSYESNYFHNSKNKKKSMKKSLVTCAAAFAGGIIAMAAYHFMVQPNTNSFGWNSNVPASLANFSGMPVAGGDFVVAAERTVNSVVHVKTEVKTTAYDPWGGFFGYQQQPQTQTGSGSGVIISADGYIVTNNHVIDGAEKMTVTLNNNKNYEATLVGRDPSSDIAVLKIDEQNLPAISWGNSDDVHIGQWVLAVGNPFELTSTVTAGIVSAKGRNINIIGDGKGAEVLPVESFIQTDAAVNPGNSGGALVNTNGELIGINTAIASRTGTYAGYSFAIPASIAKKVAQDIIEFGNVQRGFLGVQIAAVTEEQAKEADLPVVSGVYINNVTAGGAAESAGLEAGDIILKVAGYPVSAVPQLQEQISKFRPGNTVNLVIWRGGKEKNIEVELKNKSGRAELENFEEIAAENIASLGAEFSSPSESECKALRIQGGAKVGVLSTGKLRSAGVKTGFIVTKIDGVQVTSPEELQNILKSKSGGILLEGVYPNGTRAYYGFGI
jgi:Do/DeqQ family serine protease